MSEVESIFWKGRAPLPEKWNCKACGKDTSLDPKDYYMLKHDVWESINPDGRNGMLCMDCVETKLGRKLKAEDILPCPLTEVLNPYTSNLLKNNINQHDKNK